MNTNDTFLAIFLANKTSPRMTAWNALSEEARHSQMQEGSQRGKRGSKSIKLQLSVWVGLSARPKR